MGKGMQAFCKSTEGHLFLLSMCLDDRRHLVPGGHLLDAFGPMELQKVPPSSPTKQAVVVDLARRPQRIS